MISKSKGWPPARKNSVFGRILLAQDRCPALCPPLSGKPELPTSWDTQASCMSSAFIEKVRTLKYSKTKIQESESADLPGARSYLVSHNCVFLQIGSIWNLVMAWHIPDLIEARVHDFAYRIPWYSQWMVHFSSDHKSITSWTQNLTREFC